MRRKVMIFLLITAVRVARAHASEAAPSNRRTGGGGGSLQPNEFN